MFAQQQNELSQAQSTETTSHKPQQAISTAQRHYPYDRFKSLGPRNKIRLYDSKFQQYLLKPKLSTPDHFLHTLNDTPTPLNPRDRGTDVERMTDVD